LKGDKKRLGEKANEGYLKPNNKITRTTYPAGNYEGTTTE
jgi:hypothetical protein